MSALPTSNDQDSCDEPVLDPELRIVDAHYHAWPDSCTAITDHYGFASPLTMLDAIERSGHNVVKGVHVTTGADYDENLPPLLKPVAETIYLEDEIARIGRRGEDLFAALIATADLQLGDGISPLLDAHQAASSRFRGIRDSIAWHASPAVAYKTSPGLLATSAALASARLLADRDLVLEVWIYYTQMEDVIALAKAVPHLKIVLNHLGTPILDPKVTDSTAEILAVWKSSLSRLAKFDNVSIKAGGLLMPAAVGRMWIDKGPRVTSEELAIWQGPVFETAIDLFSPSRTMFESNFPMDKLSAGYRTLWNSFKRIARRYTEDEKAEMFEHTACRTYDIAA